MPVHYLVIPGEGHGFDARESFRKVFEAADRFLDRYLWGDGAVKVLRAESSGR